jgi:hypothetical protein
MQSGLRVHRPGNRITKINLIWLLLIRLTYIMDIVSILIVPSVFRLLNTFTIMILNIRLEISKYARYGRTPGRRRFHHVEDSKCISLDQMLKV